MSIEVNRISYVYMRGTPFEHQALQDVSLTIEEGSFTAIAGHTGSGKSTLVQHLNGLLQPATGTVTVDGIDINLKNKESVQARQLVGMVFQYPEHQLFEETVEADIAYGPLNQGLSPEQCQARVKKAMEFVGLDYAAYKDKSPFQLSGGQMRRVAIAGIIALEPKYLVLDEPAAGLDPLAKEELFQRIIKWHKDGEITVIFVSHNMDDIARIADRAIFMDKGNIIVDDTPEAAFQQEEKLQQTGLALPHTMSLLKKLKAAGLPVDVEAVSMEQVVENILKAKKENKHAK